MAEPAHGVAPPAEPPAGGTPPAPPAGTPPAPPAAAAPPAAPPAPAEPFASFPDAESFNKRIQREAAKQLKDMGVEDPAAVKKLLADRKEAERAQLTENERLKADLAESNAARDTAQGQFEEMRTRNRLAGEFAKQGITNFDYGYFLVNQKRASLGEDGELDEGKFLAELAADSTSRAALGIKDGAAPPAAAPPAAAPPANTSPTAPGATPTPPGATPPVPPKTAMDMSSDEWARRKSELGLPT